MGASIESRTNPRSFRNGERVKRARGPPGGGRWNSSSNEEDLSADGIIARMGILGDVAIRAAIERGDVVVQPMAPDAIGSNSIDLHLGPHLAVYVPRLKSPRWQGLLQTTTDHNLVRSAIDPEEGSVLVPGELYLCATVEHTSCGPYVPMLEGTSSAGRLGISVHATAGVGDVGFAGHWTLEISVVRPVLVYGGEAIAQLILHTVEGEVLVPYDKKPGANYMNADPRPQPSRLWNKPRWLG